MKRNIIRNALRGLSLTSALFVFQACYGTPQDMGQDLLIEGKVKSKTTGAPIKGIQVSVKDDTNIQTTDENGQFSFYTFSHASLTVRFKDVDSTQNGYFENKDIVVTNLVDHAKLDVELQEK